jgi:protein-L-isoaspartate(D-aspartate) O-methyltransferase
MKTVAEAVHFAHQCGTLHRDLKPQNVLVTPELEVRVLDFGLAVSSEEEEDRQKGFFEGTPLYASPEQVAGEALTPASDLFSFGSLMYRILTSEAPFNAATVAGIFDGISTVEPAFPRRIDTTIDTDLQAICLACLAKEVITVERHDELAKQAETSLQRAGVRNVRVLCGDGKQGDPEHAPFDRIIITAAAHVVPQPLLAQLAPGGTLVAPVGETHGCWMTRICKNPQGALEQSRHGRFSFVPLI